MNSTDTNRYTGDILQNFFTAYVEQALKNNRISYFRKYKQHLQFELYFDSEDQIDRYADLHNDLADEVDDSDPLHFGSIQNRTLAKELQNFPDKTRFIIQLRIVHNCSFKHIGATLGMKEEAVRVRFFRAIKKMRDHIKGEQK